MSAIVGKNYELPALDLNFAENKSLIDSITGRNLITFSRSQSGKEATYVGSDGLIKYAGADEPRFDYDPETGESLGLLIEEQRTNNILYSDALDGGKWLSPFAFSRTVNTVYQAKDPAGTFRAKEVRSTSGSGSAYHSYYSNGGVGTGNWNFSIYVKPVNITTLIIQVDNAYGVGVTGFDLSGLGSIISGPGSFTKLSNGWWRLSTYGDITTRQRADCSINYTSVGDNSVAFYLWGAQLEAGSFPTSYIPTTGTALTRSADVASITGSNFSSWYNQSEGTMFVDFDKKVIAPSSSLNILGYRHLYFRGNSSEQLRRYGANLSVSAAPTKNKIALSYNSVETSSSVNAGTVTAVAIATTSKSSLGVMNDTFGTVLSGHISRLTYWPKRLPDLELQQLTK